MTTHGYMNHTVRTEQWRYIRYADGREELYDETKDPMEWTNLAGKEESSSLKEQLRKLMPTTNVSEPGSYFIATIAWQWINVGIGGWGDKPASMSHSLYSLAL